MHLLKPLANPTAAAMLMAFGLTTSINAHAEADPNLWPVVKESFFGKKPMQEVDFITISGPKRAESGAQVPVTLTLDNTKAKGVVIKKLYLIVDANPIPMVATYHLTDALGNFNLATRIRQETDSFIHLVGEDASGKLYVTNTSIRAAGGCGGTIEANDAEVRAAAGKMKLSVSSPVQFGQPNVATLMVKHPMRTGLQRDQASLGYIPAYYIKKLDISYNKQPLMTVDVNVGTAEDPYYRFDFIPKQAGVLKVAATDNEGKDYQQQLDVK